MASRGPRHHRRRADGGVSIDDRVRRLAVEPFRHSKRGRPWRLRRTDHTVIALSPSPALTLVDGTRTSDVETAVAEVRELLREEDRTVATWIVGPLSEPTDLEARLLELGLGAADGGAFESTGSALAIDRAPKIDVPADVRVREVTEAVDVRTSLAIELRCNGISDDIAPTWLEPMVATFDPSTHSLFLAEIDGEPVAAGATVPTADGVWLTGAGTLPEARGRGAYRALLTARWQQAVDRGTPAMVVQAGSMSRPVLERAGFVYLGELRYLRDEL